MFCYLMYDDLKALDEATVARIRGLFKKLKEARLVGCVKMKLLYGSSMCPMLDVCPYSPEHRHSGLAATTPQRWDFTGRLSYSQLYFMTDQYDTAEAYCKAVNELIDEVQKEFELALQVSEECPLRRQTMPSSLNPVQLDLVYEMKQDAEKWLEDYMK